MIVTLALPDAAERLIEKRTITESGCWEWEGYRDRDGYGIVSVAGRDWRVHRLSAALWLDFDISSRLFICHACDNPPCFNPAHLWPGSPAENTDDAKEKGRLYRVTTHPRVRQCEACGVDYEPHPDHRGRSIVCSLDCLNAWRSATAKGRGSKVTAETASVMRALVAAGWGYREVGEMFGVSGSCVHRNLNGRRGAA